MVNHSTLPDVTHARLPETYENAQKALAECQKIDECQAWADKAEALASYAKQADDDSLRKMADRIQARAIRRAGELLKQIEPGKGGQPYQSGSTRSGDHPSRKQAATDAGLSDHQRKQALHVANILSTPAAGAGRKWGSNQLTYSLHGNFSILARTALTR